MKHKILIFLSLVTASAYQLFLQFYWKTESMLNLIADDAYISLVYARNFFEGNGLVYNIGEQVEGYTNFLWVMIMTVPFFFEWDPSIFITICGSISSILLIIVTYLLSRHFFSIYPSLLITLAIALSSHIAYFSVWGLETIFYVFLWTFALLLFLKNQLFLSGIFFALAAMTRMEILFIYLSVITFYLFYTVGQRNTNEILKNLILIILGFIVLYVPYFLWRYDYYGYLFPNTYYAKSSSYGSRIPLLKRGISYVLEQLGALNILILTIGSFLIGAIGLISYLRKRGIEGMQRQEFLPIALTCLYLAYVVWTGGDAFHERFIIHFLPILILSCALLYRIFLNHTLNVSFEWPIYLILAPFVVALAFAMPSFSKSVHWAGWITLGKKLNETGYQKQKTLATDAAGALKYYSQLLTIDILGLNDKHIAHLPIQLGRGGVGHEKQDNTYVLGRAPDYISTWVDPDGGAGRGFKKWYDFRRWYTPHMLLQTNSDKLSDERILEDISQISRCKLAELSDRSNEQIYDWAVWNREETPRAQVLLKAYDFDSTFENTLGDCNNSYIAKIEKTGSTGHLIYGPYMVLPDGKYVATLTGEIYDCLDGDKASVAIDIYNGYDSLAWEYIYAEKTSGTLKFKRDIAYDFANNKGDEKFQLRVFTHGICKIKIDTVSLAERK